MIRKLGIIGAGVATLSIALVGCGQAASTTTAPGAKGTVTGQFSWKRYSGQTITVLAETQPWTDEIKPMTAQFTKLTGIKVRWEIYTEEQRRQIAEVQLQSHSPSFDVNMSLKSFDGPAYSQAGWYENLTPFLKNSALTSPQFDAADFEAGPWKSQIFNGQLDGIPTNVEGPVLWYRTDLFQKYGLTPPKSLNQVVEDAKLIEQKSHGQYYGMTSRGLPAAVAYTFGTFLHNEGGHWLKNGKPDLASPDAIKALTLYANMLKNDGPPGVVNYNFLQSSALFGQGKVAMEFESSNELADILSEATPTVLKNFSVEEFPPGSGGSHPTVLSWSLAMNPYSQQKDAAWYFIQWATSAKIQLELAQKGIASPRKSTWASPAFKASLTGVKTAWAKALTATLAQGNPDVGPKVVAQSEARQDIGLMVDQVILNQASPVKAATSADAQIKSAIATSQ